MARKATIVRKTNETDITITIDIDGVGNNNIDTGIGFFDHMLSALSKHSGIDMDIKCIGDLVVDGHHSVEDVGIALGKAFDEAMGDKKGIRRFASFEAPLDEALGKAVFDISGRPFLVFDCDFSSDKVGELETQLVEEFMRAFAYNAQVTLHISAPYGTNDHHKAEAMFKSLARAIREAASIDKRFEDQVISTKGVI